MAVAACAQWLPAGRPGNHAAAAWFPAGKSIDTLADDAGVSHRTMANAARVAKKAAPEVWTVKYARARRPLCLVRGRSAPAPAPPEPRTVGRHRGECAGLGEGAEAGRQRVEPARPKVQRCTFGHGSPASGRIRRQRAHAEDGRQGGAGRPGAGGAGGGRQRVEPTRRASHLFSCRRGGILGSKCTGCTSILRAAAGLPLPATFLFADGAHAGRPAPSPADRRRSSERAEVAARPEPEHGPRRRPDACAPRREGPDARGGLGGAPGARGSGEQHAGARRPRTWCAPETVQPLHCERRFGQAGVQRLHSRPQPGASPPRVRADAGS